MAGDYATAPFVNVEDTVLISGFWRSGTTWVQESVAGAIGAKTIFEPFNPDFVSATNALYGKEFCLPYADSSATIKPVLRRFSEKMLRAQLSGTWVRRLRSSSVASWNRQIVCKVVRGQLALKGLIDQFSIPVVHIHRPPQAIIASLRRGTSLDLFWANAVRSLQQHLLGSRDERKSFFGRWRDDICKLDRASPLERLVALWGLIEHHVSEHIEADARSLVVGYNDLCRAGGRKIREYLKDRGYEIDRVLSSSASDTTDPERNEVDVEERLWGWKRELTADERLKIESILQRLELTYLLERYSTKVWA